IRFASVAVAVLAYNRRDLPALPAGPGLLVPRREGRCLASAAFETAVFPGSAPDGLTLVRVLLGGAGREFDVQGDEAQAARRARGELRELLGLGEAHPRWTRVARWPQACPQYAVGHGLRLRRLESCLRSFPGLCLARDSYRGLGTAECVRSGRQAARAVLERGRSGCGVLL
ncbi:MAG: FAD-dependent oxidoreductase, partial [Elusimicrobia bacterium]|nr:FAD-dependent oxidoreductase [Elusimicrobiota bacterium]